MNFAAQKVGQFGFVYVQISADEQHDITVVRIFLIDNCFAALFFGCAQKFADVHDGVGYWEYEPASSGREISSRWFFYNRFRRLQTGAVGAAFTNGNRIFSYRGQQHKFVG